MYVHVLKEEEGTGTGTGAVSLVRFSTREEKLSPVQYLPVSHRPREIDAKWSGVT